MFTEYFVSIFHWWVVPILIGLVLSFVVGQAIPYAYEGKNGVYRVWTLVNSRVGGAISAIVTIVGFGCVMADGSYASLLWYLERFIKAEHPEALKDLGMFVLGLLVVFATIAWICYSLYNLGAEYGIQRLEKWIEDYENEKTERCIQMVNANSDAHSRAVVLTIHPNGPRA